MPLIGEGSYGKVYRPPKPCKSVHKSRSKLAKVGKVFKKDYSYKEEYQTMSEVKKLNSGNEFTIPMLYACPEVKQIVYADGGQDLYDYMNMHAPRHSAFIKLVEQMRYVCRGIIKLQTHDYVHMDIKVENLVYNGKKLYLIDFGLMKHKSKIYGSLYEFDYPTDPPEFKRYLSKDRFVARFKKNFQGTNLLLHIGTYYKDMEKDLKSLLSHPSYPTDKIDVYSLGIVIAQLYRWYRRSGPVLPGIESIIVGMICMDPSRRLTANEALAKIDLFLGSRKHV